MNTKWIYKMELEDVVSLLVSTQIELIEIEKLVNKYKFEDLNKEIKFMQDIINECVYQLKDEDLESLMKTEDCIKA